MVTVLSLKMKKTTTGKRERKWKEEGEEKEKKNKQNATHVYQFSQSWTQDRRALGGAESTLKYTKGSAVWNLGAVIWCKHLTGLTKRDWLLRRTS